MSKSFCRLGFANGSVDDDAVSGNAIDGGELIINLDDTEPIPFDIDGDNVAGSLAADNELSNRWLGNVVTIEWLNRFDDGAAAAVADDDAVVVIVDVTNVGCIRSISGLVIASNKNDNRKSTQ